jgi:hypothetical protein
MDLKYTLYAWISATHYALHVINLNRVFHLTGTCTCDILQGHVPVNVKNLNLSYIYSVTSRSIIFHIYGNVTIAGEWLQNIGLCWALRTFEQGGIFIVPYLLLHVTSFFFRKDRTIQSPLTIHEMMRGIHSNPDPHIIDSWEENI